MTRGEDYQIHPIVFLLTRPSRGVTTNRIPLLEDRQFLLTRPSRGVTILPHWKHGRLLISTHTPLAGRDYACGRFWRGSDISTHTPLAGRDKMGLILSDDLIGFLLTRPSRGVTVLIPRRAGFILFLLTRPSRGVTNPTQNICSRC